MSELPASVQRRIRDTTGKRPAKGFSVKDLETAGKRALDKIALPAPKIDPHVELLFAQVMALNMAAPLPEYPLVEDRKFRIDLAWPEIRVAVEIDGMVHRTKERFLSDRAKRNIAAYLGWRMFSVSPAEVRSGEAAKAIAVWLLTTPAFKGEVKC